MCCVEDLFITGDMVNTLLWTRKESQQAFFFFFFLMDEDTEARRRGLAQGPTAGQ